jgi:hypothetical protein
LIPTAIAGIDVTTNKMGKAESTLDGKTFFISKRFDFKVNVQRAKSTVKRSKVQPRQARKEMFNW